MNFYFKIRILNSFKEEDNDLNKAIARVLKDFLKALNSIFLKNHALLFLLRYSFNHLIDFLNTFLKYFNIPILESHQTFLF